MFKLPYFLEGIGNIFKPVLTDEEPLDEKKGAQGYRGKLTFNKDACIGCGICIRVCAGDAIKKDVKKVEDGQEITMTFDLYSCTFCGLCKDFCPKSAIGLTNEMMMVETEKENLVIGGSFIKKTPPKPAPKVKQAVEIKTEDAEKTTDDTKKVVEEKTVTK